MLFLVCVLSEIIAFGAGSGLFSVLKERSQRQADRAQRKNARVLRFRDSPPCEAAIEPAEATFDDPAFD